MVDIKKQQWSEAEVLALPTGEHDYFERKSGQIFDKTDWQSSVAKALCALANSGGGHIILGVRDDGTLDGVNPIPKGKIRMRDWLEQILPHFLIYPLQDFRVHEVVPTNPSTIPANKVIIVIDVGDSSLAPHQTEDTTHHYYYRSGGRSQPAPHFYLETLRNRLTAPCLEAELSGISVETAYPHEEGIFVELKLAFLIKNTGRIAAYKWGLSLQSTSDIERLDDFHWEFGAFPKGNRGRSGGIPLDTTILPGFSRKESRDLGVYIHPCRMLYDEIYSQLNFRFIPQASIYYKVATEFSPGELTKKNIHQVVGMEDIASQILNLCTPEQTAQNA